jgi:hypothetical protein
MKLAISQTGVPRTYNGNSTSFRETTRLTSFTALDVKCGLTAAGTRWKQKQRQIVRSAKVEQSYTELVIHARTGSELSLSDLL